MFRTKPFIALAACLPAIILVWELAAIWRAQEIARAYFAPWWAGVSYQLDVIASAPPLASVVGGTVALAAFFGPMAALILGWRALRRKLRGMNRPNAGRFLFPLKFR